MRHIRFGKPLFALFGLVLFLATGCGPGKGTPVSGKVVLPPAVSFAKDDQVEITFVPDDPKVKRGATAMVTAQDMGNEVSFTANTSETTGVLPGKYKVAVKVTPYAGAPGTEARKRQVDQAVNKKHAPDVTTLTYEVTGAGPQTITIDLGKGTVTKN